MKEERKKRAPNFTFAEKENLLSLVAKYKDIVECKKTGAFYIQKKKDVWQSITKQFNSFSSTICPREEIQLKHFYDNLKHRARKMSTENKHFAEHDLSSVLEIINVPPDPEIYDQMDDNGTKPNDMDIEEFRPCSSTPQIQIDEHSSVSIPNYQTKHNRGLRNGMKGLYIKQSSELLTRIYLKRKIAVTYYQKQNELLKLRNERAKHNITMQILKSQLRKAKKDEDK